MKANVKICNIIGQPTTATIVINKDGMSVINKSDYCSDSDICKGFIKQLVDMDHWKFSWYMDLSRAQSKGSEERKKVREIMLEKISEREKEIKDLKNGIQVLGRWNYGIR